MTFVDAKSCGCFFWKGGNVVTLFTNNLEYTVQRSQLHNLVYTYPMRPWNDYGLMLDGQQSMHPRMIEVPTIFMA